ncbi:CBS domain-containing protein [Hydrogenophaga pseudoflava]|uniref:CBS domain-containing protein n=1 Tax=Hydrogenophaga pseudoflava TaxID=47421 RepID=UPI0027E4B148|nr:CBS domain-containing protein [Hydrogenophaga pseudoflava]MDQ7744359.1 CBS domain-containing protein [Hydrogenophaga pseudoflava]
MPTVSEVMTPDPQSVPPEESLRAAAELMQTLDIGVLPVCDAGTLVGMLTDRDIAVRSVAGGLVPESTCVGDIMSPDLVFCTPGQDIGEAMKLMGDKQVRRLPVIDDDRRLVGIVSLADLALRQGGHIDQAVRDISAPESPRGERP